MRHSRIFLWTAGFGLLSTLALAQVPDPRDGAVGAVPAEHRELLGRPSVFRNVGLQSSDGRLIGGGPRYTVLFGDQGITYTPALGKAAPRTLPLGLRLESVRRDSSVWMAVTPARSHRDDTVRYARPGYEERYELRLHGLKQSFVFDRLPEGAGDLVVRLRCDTELTPASFGLTDEALRFELPGVGAVVCGEVLGIDAAGREVLGTMRSEPGVLELILPGSFVDSAALPLVLDPLIGTAVTAGTSGDDYEDPDIAYDATNDVYYVVWEQWISANDQDVRGQRVNPDGTFAAGADFLGLGSTNDGDPKVANVNSQDAFVVVWQRFETPTTPAKIRGRAVLASTGVAGPATDLVTGSHNHVMPDIGGERNASSSFNDAILVWRNATSDTIRCRRVDVAGNVLSVVGSVQLLAQGGMDANVNSPAISKSGGSSGRFLIVWTFTITLFAPPHMTNLGGAIVSRNLGFVDNFIPINPGPTTHDNDDPDVDGDGNSWVVAWERSEDLAGGSPKDDIVCRAVRFSGSRPAGDRGYASGNTIVVEGDLNHDEQDPSVCWVGGAVLIGYEDEIGGRFNGVVESVDPFTCTSCENGVFNLVSGVRDEQDVALASTWSGGAPGDSSGALIALEVTDGTGNGNIRVRRFESRDGLVTILPGGCGTGRGIHFTSCARVGHGDFQFTLRNAPPSSTAWLVLSFERLGLSCGSCQLVPDPYSGWVIARTTDGNGDAAVSMPIPNSAAVRGMLAYQQWVVPNSTSPACLALQANFSTPTRVEIQ